MGVQGAIIVLAVAAVCLFSTAAAVPGTASFSSTNPLPSACYANEDKGTMIAAANPAMFNYGVACGQNYTIQCTGPINPGSPSPCRGGAVTVTIVDLCLLCAADQLELYREAFSAIADLNAGTIRIDYRRV